MPRKGENDPPDVLAKRLDLSRSRSQYIERGWQFHVSARVSNEDFSDELLRKVRDEFLLPLSDLGASDISSIDLDMMASDINQWVFTIVSRSGQHLKLQGARLVAFSKDGVSFSPGLKLAKSTLNLRTGGHEPEWQ